MSFSVILIGLFGFRNASQCVVACFPLRCPKSGLCGVSFSMSATAISFSAHLKMSVPSGFSTRKHSANPSRSISRQSSPSHPYLSIAHPGFFTLRNHVPLAVWCGGSNTTRLNDSSGNGRFVKSASTSGLITVGLAPGLVSVMCVSSRMSTNKARSSAL